MSGPTDATLHMRSAENSGQVRSDQVRAPPDRRNAGQRSVESHESQHFGATRCRRRAWFLHGRVIDIAPRTRQVRSWLPLLAA